MLSVYSDDHFMKQALIEAQKAYDSGEVPVGAVIVCQNQIIARAHNQTELLNDVTAHAEMLAYTAATQFLGAKYLTDCKLYVTLEPCTMCAGALYWSQIPEIIYGASDEKRGALRMEPNPFHPKTKLSGGVRADVCSEIMKSFFKSKRS